MLRLCTLLAVLSTTALIGCPAGGSLSDDPNERSGEGEGEGEEGEGESGEGEGESGGLEPGSACGCDSECASAPGHAGMCVFGICFQDADGACSGSGSQAECPTGSRCWPVTADDDGTCWPDCNAHTCDGTCDADGSCAPSDGATCDSTCSDICAGGGGGGGTGTGAPSPGDDQAFDINNPPPAPTQSCADIPSFECTVPGGTLDEIEAHCGELIAFDPRQGDGYDDYAINGETSSNQYRSFARRDVVMLVKYATAHTRCTAQDWTFGDSVLGLGDMSEANGTIPGTSDGQPGHPPASHERGYDMDIAYYQLGQANNRLREVCAHLVDGVEQYHCTDTPTTLDFWRTTVFIAKLMDSPQYLSVGVDGKAGPIITQAGAVLCSEGVISGKACGSQGFSAPRRSMGRGISYDVSTSDDIGWFYFHHHHLHLSVFDKKGGFLSNW